MKKINTQTIQQLRQQTGAGISDCKKALDEANGNMNKAVEILRKKGQKVAAAKQAREIKQGLVEAYIHAEGKIGVMIELGCETDFVVRNKEFKELAHDLAMQVAAVNPLYVSPDDVPNEVIEKEKEIIHENIETLKHKNMKTSKQKEIMEKIVQGKLEKYYQEVCLLKQLFIKDDKMTVEELITEKVAKLGENIVVRRFVKFSL